MSTIDHVATIIGYMFMAIGGPALLIWTLAEILGRVRMSVDFMRVFAKATREFYRGKR